MPASRVARSEPRQFTGDYRAVGFGVAAVKEPDERIQNVMQPNGNQHAVGESIGEGAQGSGAADELAQPGETRVENRIEVTHRESDHKAYQ